MPNPTTSQLIRGLLVTRGKRNYELAEATGMSRTVLSHRLNGRSPWMLVDIQRIARFFGVPVGLVVGDLDDDEALEANPTTEPDTDEPT